MTDDPIDRMQWVAGLLRSVAGMSEQAQSCAAWLEAALRAHLYTGEPMERALGFSGARGRSPRYRALLRERNAHLSQALEAMGGDVCALRDEIERYETRVSAAQRSDAAPDPLWSDARKHIHAAALLNLELPKTTKGLDKTFRIAQN